jgi:hypothetical protein
MYMEMEMDHPFEFDIWCKVDQSKIKAMAVWCANRHSIAIFDAYKAVQDSIKLDGYVQVFFECGWDDVRQLKQTLPDFAQRDSCLISESSYRPLSCPRYCEEHSLWYANPTCPVCEGFYISKVIDGEKFASEPRLE